MARRPIVRGGGGFPPHRPRPIQPSKNFFSFFIFRTLNVGFYAFVPPIFSVTQHGERSGPTRVRGWAQNIIKYHLEFFFKCLICLMEAEGGGQIVIDSHALIFYLNRMKLSLSKFKFSRMLHFEIKKVGPREADVAGDFRRPS